MGKTIEDTFMIVPITVLAEGPRYLRRIEGGVDVVRQRQQQEAALLRFEHNVGQQRRSHTGFRLQR